APPIRRTWSSAIACSRARSWGGRSASESSCTPDLPNLEPEASVFESNVNSERAARPDPGPRAQAARNGAGSTLADRLLKGASIVSLCFLTFVAGAFMTEANVFPASLVGRAYYGAVAAYENMTMYR